jgi:hypothetical protein
MPKQDPYQDSLKQEFAGMVETLDLSDRQKYYLKSRWLEQVMWMEGKATQSRDFYYRLRLTTIIGGVIIPALVSLNFASFGGNNQEQLKKIVFFSTFTLSQVVAISAAVEQFFNYGERWRHYRRSVESLKTQGWQFFELSGTYENFTTHDNAFHEFAGNVESILQKDVEVYSTQVVQVKKEAVAQAPAISQPEEHDDNALNLPPAPTP